MARTETTHMYALWTEATTPKYSIKPTVLTQQRLCVYVCGRGNETTCVWLMSQQRVRKGLALPRLSHSSEIDLAGSRRLRTTLAAAPVL